MRVALVNLSNDPAWEGAEPPDRVGAGHEAADVTRRGLLRELTALGHEVRVFQELYGEADRGAWTFRPPSRLTLAARATLARLGRDPRVMAPATALLGEVAAYNPDVVHTFDLAFYPTLLLLARAAPRAPLVGHFHGGEPVSTAVLRPLERAALARVDRCLFTDPERAATWANAGARPALVPGSSSDLAPMDRAAARALTGWEGAPLYLSVARLDPVKDPLTVVRAFALLAADQPAARLYLLYRDAPLLDAVRAEARRLGVISRVTFRHGWPHDRMAAAYGSADVLLQASVREVCGYAVLEALACGLPPTLTDIPPWRVLTGAGRVGALVPVGDPAAMAAGAVRVLARGEGERARVRAYFEAELAFPVWARRVEAVYREVLAERSGSR